MSDPPAQGRRTDGESTISRRRLLAGGLSLVGLAGLGLGSTSGRFLDSNGATGTVQIDDDPTLSYTIGDEAQHNKAAYEVQYQVEWVADFDSIEVVVANTTDPSDSMTETRTTRSGVVTYQGSGNTAGDTYEFTFTVSDSAGNVVLQKTDTDTADGKDTQHGETGSVDTPTLEGIDVYDDRTNNKTSYTVSWEVANTATFQQVTVTFENTTRNNPKVETRTSTDPTGPVSYAKGGTGGDRYEITVDVYNDEGIVVDSQTVADVSDGDDTTWTA